MSGMQMLMSSLGLDPQMIMQSADEFKAGLIKLNADLEFIKNQNAEILARLHPEIAPTFECHMPLNGVGHG